MTRIIIYLILWLIGVIWLWVIDVRALLPEWLYQYNLVFRCVLMGALGGIVYCLRAIYINRSVHSRWNKDWHIWYYLRPIISSIVGGVSYVFLNAGLLVLDAKLTNDANAYGFLALSFIAGLNVDRFLVRIEQVAHSTWNIKPSRSSDTSVSKSGEDK